MYIISSHTEHYCCVSGTRDTRSLTLDFYAETSILTDTEFVRELSAFLKSGTQRKLSHTRRERDGKDECSVNSGDEVRARRLREKSSSKVT